MIWQLRTYRVRPGAMAAYRSLFHDHIVPLRSELGFVVGGAWFDADEDVFVWMVGHEAPDGWAAAEQTYYDDPRRSRLPNDPRDFIASVESRLLVEA